MNRLLDSLGSAPLLDPAVAGPVGAWIATFVVHSTVLFALAWLAARLVRSVEVREQLWRAALVGPLLTASLQVGAGLEPLGGTWRMPAAEPLAAAEPEPAPVEEVALPPAVLYAVARNAEFPATRAAAPVDIVSEEPAPAPTDPFGRWNLVASVLLALGLTSLTVRALVESARMRRLGARTPLDDPALNAELDDLVTSAGLRRRVRLERTSAGVSPYATGVLRPRIVVPDAARARLDRRAARAMLAHELGHIARFDAAWSAVARSLSSLLFIQPLVRVIAARLDETAEFACDAYAVRLTGDEVGLARCLTEVAEWIVGGVRPACPMAHEHSKLGERVERILGEVKSTRRTGLVARALGLVAVGTTAAAAPGIGAALDASERSVAAPAPVEPSIVTVGLETAPAPDIAFEEVFRALAAEASAVGEAAAELAPLADPSTAARARSLAEKARRIESLAQSVARIAAQR